MSELTWWESICPEDDPKSTYADPRLTYNPQTTCVRRTGVIPDLVAGWQENCPHQLPATMLTFLIIGWFLIWPPEMVGIVGSFYIHMQSQETSLNHCIIHWISSSLDVSSTRVSFTDYILTKKSRICIIRSSPTHHPTTPPPHHHPPTEGKPFHTPRVKSHLRKKQVLDLNVSFFEILS